MKKFFIISMIAFTFVTIGCGGGGVQSVSASSPGSGAPSASVSVTTAFTAGISHIDGNTDSLRTTIYLRAHRKSATSARTRSSFI